MLDDETLEENNRSSWAADCQQVYSVPESIDYIDSYLWQPVLCVCVCVCARKYSRIHLHANVKASVFVFACALEVIGICFSVFSTCFM